MYENLRYYIDISIYNIFERFIPLFTVNVKSVERDLSDEEKREKQERGERERDKDEESAKEYIRKTGKIESLPGTSSG